MSSPLAVGIGRDNAMKPDLTKIAQVVAIFLAVKIAL
jgi:hypothetical protein